MKEFETHLLSYVGKLGQVEVKRGKALSKRRREEGERSDKRQVGEGRSRF